MIVYICPATILKPHEDMDYTYLVHFCTSKTQHSAWYKLNKKLLSCITV